MGHVSRHRVNINDCNVHINNNNNNDDNNKNNNKNNTNNSVTKDIIKYQYLTVY
jgi:hypothetical protein